MKITHLIWLDAVVEKIESKHQVNQTEVEEVFSSRPQIRKMQKGRLRGEDVYRVLGQTFAGRHLAVFFIYKQTGDALILSARDMDHKERRGYAAK
jgi:uncharacterized protein